MPDPDEKPCNPGAGYPKSPHVPVLGRTPWRGDGQELPGRGVLAPVVQLLPVRQALSGSCNASKKKPKKWLVRGESGEKSQ